jgi:Ca2+-binding RTX toxin-like protein
MTCRFENLESRKLMAASAAVVDGILNIEGTNESDRIAVTFEFSTVQSGIGVSVRSNYRVRVTDSAGTVRSDDAGQTLDRTFNTAGISRIEISALGGADLVNVSALIADTKLLLGGGNDTALGGAGTDEISGASGADSILGNAGNDNLTGESGDDKLYGGGNDDVLDGGYGSDSLFGEAGNDSLIGGAQSDNLKGGDGADSLDGGAAKDWLFGNGGNDVLHGGDGDDYVNGEAGADSLFGDVGHDFLFGEAGSDNLQGGPGNDWLDTGSSGETYDGGTGRNYNARKWSIGGTDRADVHQGRAHTCSLMSTLAAASYQGIDLTSKITVESPFYYKVRMFDTAVNQWVSIGVNFEGKLLQNDDGRNVDPEPVTTGAGNVTEFWVVLYQRAYLKYFKNRDINDVDSVMSFTSDDDTAKTMKNVLGRDTSTEWMPWFAEDLRAKLQNGQVVNAGGTGHRYSVLECFKDSNDVWKVKLFNPRAYDGTHNDMPIIESGESDGVFYMTWSNFTNGEYFKNYTFSRT